MRFATRSTLVALLNLKVQCTYIYGRSWCCSAEYMGTLSLSRIHSDCHRSSLGSMATEGPNQILRPTVSRPLVPMWGVHAQPSDNAYAPVIAALSLKMRAASPEHLVLPSALLLHLLSYRKCVETEYHGILQAECMSAYPKSTGQTWDQGLVCLMHRHRCRVPIQTSPKMQALENWLTSGEHNPCSTGSHANSGSLVE